MARYRAMFIVDSASKKETYLWSWILKLLLVGTKSKDTSAFQGG